MASEESKDAKTGSASFIKINEDISIKPTTKLIGLTKEELEEYRNDPVWKVVRYVAFALFWAVWIVMFVGAILIVVLSPKCNDRKIDDNLVSYRIFVPAFYDSDNDGIGDFKGIQEKLAILKNIGVSGISPTPLFKTANDSVEFLPEQVVDLDSVEDRFGGESHLNELIKAAHNAKISFIADIPLAISKNNLNSKLTGDTSKSSIVLDVNNAEVIDKLFTVSVRLLKLGVDGLHFTDYGLASSNTKQYSVLNSLIEKILEETKSNSEIKQKDLFISVESKWGKELKSAKYAETLLVDENPSNNVIENVKKQINEGIASIRRNTTPKVLWKNSDIHTLRLDQRISNVNDKLKSASIALQLIQTFLPGPVSVYYGEELGLPSANQNSQRGLMRWDSTATNYGFSENKETKYFPTISGNEKVAFNDELTDTHSPLNVFKSVLKLRQQNSDLLSFDWATETQNSIHYYSRFDKNDNDKTIYVLAVHWPSNGNATETLNVIQVPPQLVQNRSLKNVAIIAQSIQSTKYNENIDLTTGEVKLGPYDAVLFQVAKQTL